MDNALFTPSQRDTIRPSTRSDARPLPALASQDGAPSICRICRGEATVSEPLFYPCKCSGSIKYVHQECLMEWLSHSQKKHCELCKTSFRFTKLYAPDMPQSLPFHVFLEHMTKWLFRNVLVWLRALLTISIWMGWLPYFMRTVWSFVFWVSDEGLGGSQIMPRQKTIENEPLLLSISMASGQCPVTPLQPKTMTTIKEVDSMMKILSNNKFPDYFVKLILGSLGMPLEVNSTDLPKGWLSASNITTMLGGSNIRNMSTLLSDVPILRNLTRSPAVNRVVVSIIEGQIITVLVIIAFILVILVRDYVIQQQPEINMRAAFAPPEQQAQQQPQQPQQPPQGERPNHEEAQLPLPDDHEQGQDERDHPQQLPMQPPRHPDFNFNFNDAPAQNQPQAREDTGPGLRGEPELDAFGAPPGDADDNSLNPPAERQETVAEIQFGMREYLRMYKEAHGDPYTILQMIADEGLEDRMQYWVDMTEGMIRREEEISDSDGGYEPEDVVRTVEIEAVRQAYDKKRRRAIFGNVNGESSAAARSSGDASDQDIPDVEALFDGIPLPPNHGLFDSSPLRPRAASAGTANRQGPHPLANNTWTFADLPPPQSSQDNQHADDDSDSHDGHVQNTRMASSVSHGSWSDSNTRFTDDNGQGSERDDRVEVDIPPPTQAGHQADNPTGEAATNPIAVEAVAPPEGNVEGGVLARLADFMWGDVDQAALLGDPVIDEADEQWVDLPVAGGAVDEEPGPEADEEDDDEGAAAAAAAGFDQEAIEDMEDFEGVMELIGMRGPIAGLFQNAIFCVVLVSVTILACIFIPYNIGRVTVWGMANPGRMMRMIVEFAKLIQDIVILFGGVASWFAINILEMIMSPINGSLANSLVAVRKMVWSIWTHAGARVFEYRIFEPPMTATEMQSFSAISHAALVIVKANVRGVFVAIGRVLASIYHSETSIISIASLKALPVVARNVANFFSTYSHVLLNPNSWVIDLGEIERMAPVDPDLVNWSGMDRFWAIIAGYGTLFTAGALYLKRDMPFSTGDVMRAWEAGVIDSLHQASGIMKVIIIISIEMLVFPLYCGLLLDIALLPLFGNATVASRVMFTYQYPLTSAFVHWFVGTGYMFHFALFVSMCRKIMRSGVLYFIRDPDDPEFHPIRDVLDKNLATQLRKILFSAFVYGALVIVCLGGVVWGLRYTLPTVLPIHYSSNEPVLEFPVDLLFYNFLMPLAVKFFKPSDAIHAMYTWWFRKCARGLRLTFFLFGQRKIDEEGILQLPADSTHEPTFYNRHFLELDERNRVIPKTWKDTFDDGGPKPTTPLSKMERRTLKLRKSYLVSSGQLIKDGTFVRAPASDRIKIPKGQKIFLAVSEGNKRKDELEDNDMYGSEQYQYVYIPPNFRTRILSFILFIWLFAAITGVGFTIVPLIFGRMIFKLMIPEYVRTNDIYAFSIGVYLLGSAVYAVVHMQRLWGQAKDWLRQAAAVAMSTDSVKRAASLALQGLKLVYTYLFLVVVFPLLVAAFMELYVAIPLHTYMSPPTGASMDSAEGMDGQTGRHSVRVIQAWVLGLLYLKLGSKMLTTTWPESRPSIAVQLVLRRGWADPDVGIFTRGFVLPGLLISLFAIAGPPLATNVLIKNNLIGQALIEATEAETAARMAIIYRYSYPVAASCAAVIRYSLALVNMFNGWTAGIRDEAYLIGERLHNFGAATAGARKTGQAWRAGGTRL